MSAIIAVWPKAMHVPEGSTSGVVLASFDSTDTSRPFSCQDIRVIRFSSLKWFKSQVGLCQYKGEYKVLNSLHNYISKVDYKKMIIIIIS